jgi:hypothetical protein
MSVQVVLGGEADPAEDLLAMAGRRQRGLPGGCLREQRAKLVMRRVEGRLGAFERHERLGQPVPHGLERRERLAELDTVQGVRPGEGEHGPAGASEPPADRAPAGRERHRAPRAPRAPRVPAGHRGHHAQRQVPVKRRTRPVDTLPHHPGTARVRQRRRAARRQPARRQQHVVEQRRVRSGLAEQPEHHRYRDFRQVGEQLPPAQLGQREVEDTPGRREHRLPERLGEQVQLGLARCVYGVRGARTAHGVHAYSFPRSSSLRAMMLRWISAVPP